MIKLKSAHSTVIFPATFCNYEYIPSFIQFPIVLYTVVALCHRKFMPPYNCFARNRRGKTFWEGEGETLNKSRSNSSRALSSRSILLRTKT